MGGISSLHSRADLEEFDLNPLVYKQYSNGAYALWALLLDKYELTGVTTARRLALPTPADRQAT